jgi:hypothetical protein
VDPLYDIEQEVDVVVVSQFWHFAKLALQNPTL